MVYRGEGIHPTAIVASSAVLGEGTSVGPYSVIGPKVRIGKNNRIGSHVVIEGNTTLGNDNTIYQFASVGAEPQDLKYHGEESTLTLGDGNIVREFVTMQPGTEGGGMKTVVGNKNLFMANCHLGHDGIVGDGNVFANSAALAGHVTIGNRVTVGGLTGIHQFVRVGDFAILSGGSMVVKDIPPYCTAQGDRCYLVGLNPIGLQRGGMSDEDIQKIKVLYRDVILGSGLLKSRIETAREKFQSFKPALAFLDFIGTSSRGVTMARRARTSDNNE